MLSACMIVQDEEECLNRALDSIHGYVDEIIVVDGGSIDNTRKIAMSYPKVKLYDVPMDSDFAVQRNKSIELSTGDFVLVVDADEFYDDYTMQSLPRLAESTKYDAFAFSRKTFIDGMLVNLHDHDFQIRLFSRKCRYASSELGIHESVTGYTRMQLVNLDIKHYKKSEWQHKDNIRCWDAGQPPPPGWEKHDGIWVYVNQLEER